METLKGPRVKRPPEAESYDQKLEQRAAKHEFLRDRNNATTCRSPGRRPEAERKSEGQRKRQMEFLRRRPVEERERHRDAKVTLRTSRQRAALVKRQSFVSAEELGIMWPDVHSLPSMTTWIVPPLPHGAEAPSHTGRQNVSSQALPPDPGHQEAPPGSGLEARDGVHGDQGGDLLTRRPQTRNAGCQTEYGYVTVKEAEILQLAEYLKEALWREESLKQKLSVIQHSTSTLLLSQHNMWKSCFSEDLMKGKIVSLESQLKICVQRLSRDGAKRLLLGAEQQRQAWEQTAAAGLQRLTVQKTQAQNRADSLEVALQTTQAESTMWRERYEEERGNCAHLRKSLEHNIDQLHKLQNQLESPVEQEVGPQSLTSGQQHCQAELSVNTSHLQAQRTPQTTTAEDVSENRRDQLQGTPKITLWDWPTQELPQIKLF